MNPCFELVFRWTKKVLSLTTILNNSLFNILYVEQILDNGKTEIFG